MRPGLVVLLSAGNFVIGMGAFVVIGVLGPIAEGLSVEPGAAGLTLTVYALAYAVGSPVLVALTGGWARRTVLLTGLGLFALATLAAALAPGLPALLATRAFAALGAGLFTPTAAAVAVALAPPERRGAALSNVFFGLTLAQVLGVPAGGLLAYAFGWRTAFLATAALAPLVLAALALRTPRDLAFQPTRLATLGAALKDGRAMAGVLFTATFLGAIYVPYTYLGPILSAAMGWDGAQISAALLVFGLGAVAGNLLGGRLSDRIGAPRTLLLLVAGQAALMPGVSLLPLPVWLVFALVLVWSAFGWSFIAPQQSLLVSLAPDRTNVLLALNAAAIYVGAAAGSAVGASVIARAGTSALGVAGAAGMALALANLLLVLRLRRRA